MLSVAEQQDWRAVLRAGVLPHAPAEGLESLADALRRGDPRLCRRANFEPHFLCPDMPVVACCPLAWLGWQGRPGVRVAEVDAAWMALLGQCARATGSPLAVQSVIDVWDGWGGSEYDDEPLTAGELLVEVEAELARRAAVEGASDGQ